MLSRSGTAPLVLLLVVGLVAATVVALVVDRTVCDPRAWSAVFRAEEDDYVGTVFAGCAARASVRGATESEVRRRAAEFVDRTRALEAAGPVTAYPPLAPGPTDH